jgi:general secretion pathway protein A
MYESFYGLKEKPFNLLPDPDYLYMSKSHDNAYTHLEYAISENKGFVIVTGEIGSGKTTLINYLLKKIPQDLIVGLINNTFISPDQLLKVICHEFDIPIENRDKAQLLAQFQDFIIRQFSKKKRVVLFVDEAQNLSPEALEEVRLLSNLEAEKSHLIQIILVGQPELRLKLQRSDLKQFAQRVSVHCHLKGLDNGEVQKYIVHRLKAAGAQKTDLFNKDSIDLISKYSNGIPRLINVLCDTSLVYGFADGEKIITKDIVSNVIEARETGGILTKALGGIESNITKLESVVDEEQNTNYDLLINSIEKRLQLVESFTVGMDQRISQMSQKKDERDMVVLELFKMLKGSIENRLNLVAKFNQLKRQLDPKKKPSVNETPEKVVVQKIERPSKIKKTILVLIVLFGVILSLLFLDQIIVPLKTLFQWLIAKIT